MLSVSFLLKKQDWLLKLLNKEDYDVVTHGNDVKSYNICKQHKATFDMFQSFNSKQMHTIHTYIIHTYCTRKYFNTPRICRRRRG